MLNKMSEFLDLVRRGRPITDLETDGFLYYQVSKVLTEALTSFYVKFNEEDSLFITEEGMEFLNKNPPSARSNKAKWIEPLNEKRIPAMEIDEIYIPDRAVVVRLRRG